MGRLKADMDLNPCLVGSLKIKLVLVRGQKRKVKTASKSKLKSAFARLKNDRNNHHTHIAASVVLFRTGVPSESSMATGMILMSNTAGRFPES